MIHSKHVTTILWFLFSSLFSQAFHGGTLPRRGTAVRQPNRFLKPCSPSNDQSLLRCKASSNDNQDQRRWRNKRQRRWSTEPQTWRLFGVLVHPDLMPEATISDKLVTRPIFDALMVRLKIPNEDNYYGPIRLPPQLSDIRIIRRSLDARKKRINGEGPMYSFVLDIDVVANANLRLRQQPGRTEQLTTVSDRQSAADQPYYSDEERFQKQRVVIVGAGPAGLFCALRLARSGLATPILLERGQPVEARGKDIGALMHRQVMDSESNFAFGEGGAGTWSDGKLTTRIGRNSDQVRFVLETFVEYGAPESILVEGGPHLGTDNLVRILRNMRNDLRDLGGEIRFGAKVTGIEIDQSAGCATGVHVTYGPAVERGTPTDVPTYEGSETIRGDAVVLATGHSARDVYEDLYAAGIQLETKGFAVGFRVEHPQKLINKIQYGSEWGASVITGRPATDAVNQKYFESQGDGSSKHAAKLPVPSYRLATDKAFDGKKCRSVYSFCMCPGGQIVPSSTDANEVCVNGMSFSRRDSLWANAAIVVSVADDDEVLEEYREKHGPLAGVAFQREMERRAAKLGGGKLKAPVQRLTDFVEGRASTSAPPSSYRLGVTPAACHEIYPAPLTNALRDAIVSHFELQIPGFLCEDGLLHGVETRTSSPVRVSRDGETLQAIGVKRLFPSGEGAGFAGGIVSSAVDGMMVAEALLSELYDGESKGVRSRSSIGYYY